MTQKEVEEVEVVEQTRQREILHCDHEVCGFTSDDDVEFVKLSVEWTRSEDRLNVPHRARDKRIHICENCFKREFTELDSDEYEVASLATDNEGGLSVAVWKKAWFAIEMHMGMTQREAETSKYTVQITSGAVFILMLLLLMNFGWMVVMYFG